jgi:hypothetical protein
MKNPAISTLIKYGNKIPCYEIAKSIIQSEVENHNEILYAGDTGRIENEVIITIDFSKPSCCEYDGLRHRELRNGHPYKSLILSDDYGRLEIHFDRVYG